MIPLSEDEAHRSALDAMLKADGWVLAFYITDEAGNDIPDCVTSSIREVPYILDRSLTYWSDTLDAPRGDWSETEDDDDASDDE